MHIFGCRRPRPARGRSCAAGGIATSNKAQRFTNRYSGIGALLRTMSFSRSSTSRQTLCVA